MSFLKRAVVLATAPMLIAASAPPRAAGAHAGEPARTQLFVSGSKAAVASPAVQASCREAARALLGPKGLVLDCGHLTGPGAIEAVIAVPTPGLAPDWAGVPVSGLLVARRESGRWIRELSVDQLRGVYNRVGYVDMYFKVDCVAPGPFRIQLETNRPEADLGLPALGFGIWLTYLTPRGYRHGGVTASYHHEGVAAEIAWNPRVRRFQYFEDSYDPMGFQAERWGLSYTRPRHCNP